MNTDGIRATEGTEHTEMCGEVVVVVCGEYGATWGRAVRATQNVIPSEAEESTQVREFNYACGDGYPCASVFICGSNFCPQINADLRG